MNIMKFYSSILVTFTLLFASIVSIAEEENLKCNIGPIVKNYGGNDWAVYSCTDNASAIIVSVAESPAHPFYFMFAKQNADYQLIGEGTGNQSATAAAYAELETFSPVEIEQLVLETKQE